MLPLDASRVITDYVSGRVWTSYREGIDISWRSFAIDGEEFQTYNIV
jgi:hypothetical protein